MPTSEADLQAVAAYQATYGRVLDALSVRIRLLWESLGSWDASDVPRLASLADPVAIGSRRSAVALVDSYTARLAHVRPLGLTADLTDSIVSPRRVDALDLWRRPFVEHWGALSAGSDWQDAYSLGRARAVTLATQDLQRVTDHAIARVLEVHETAFDDLIPDLVEPPAPAVDIDDPELDPRPAETLEEDADFADAGPRRIVGYRRVLTGRSCLFCAAASTQTYSARSLRRLHAHCDCGIAPIFADSDPGAAVNAELLARLKERGPDYWRRHGVVEDDFDPDDPPEGLRRWEDHPELGPMLVTY